MEIMLFCCTWCVEYKKKANDKKVKKVLAENEYYIQRYSDLMKVRANNAEG
jgi:hypothetical protein